MDLRLHLCGPKGDGSRMLLDRALAMLQLDNEFVVQAMLRSGMAVPDSVEQLGIPYRDDVVLDPNSERQEFRALRQMLDYGSWSCGEGAPLEAAVLQVKYKIPARAFVRFGTDDGFWHAVYETPQGIVDPVQRYLANGGRRVA